MTETTFVIEDPRKESVRHAREDCPTLADSEVEERPVDDVDLDRCVHCHDDLQVAPKDGTPKKLWEMDPDEVGRTNTEGSA